MRVSYGVRGFNLSLRRALLIILLIAIFTLSLLQISGLSSRELILCSNGYCNLSAVEGFGVNFSVNVDYAIRYTVFSLVKPEGFTLKLTVYANVSGSLRDISGPYMNSAGETGYIDIPVEVGQSFNVPLVYVESPIRHVIPAKVIESLEPGVLAASYEAPGLRVSASLRYDLIVESLKVSVEKGGSYRVIVELLDGYKVLDVLTLDCSGACHTPLSPKTKVTAFNISIVEESLAGRLSKQTLIPLIAITTLLALLELKPILTRKR